MAIEIEWEKFLGGPTLAPEKRWHATLTPQLRIHLNKNIFVRLGRPAAVSLFFNRGEQKIGIQAASPRFNYSFPVGVLASQTTHYVPAAPFCRHFGITVSETHRFINPEFSADGKLILNLNETVLVTRKRKKKAEKK